MTIATKTYGFKSTQPQVRPTGIIAPAPHFKMNGLRMYLKSVDKGRSAPPVFYSRRGDGPYYVWRYEEKLGQWRGSRVNPSEFAPRELLMANWKIVPSALQTKLGEHYLD
jgi:hypothetical protein